jgi:hypothetical protein
MQYVEQFQKPKLKKQKRAKNNPRPTEFDTCFVCGKKYAETHEVFGGNKRQKSIKYKMQIKLCNNHHTGAEGIHRDTRFNFKVKQIYQRRFEEQYSHELFMQEFGKDYLSLTYEEFIKKGCVA